MALDGQHRVGDPDHATIHDEIDTAISNNVTAVTAEASDRAAADTAHVAATDPHGDREAATTALTAHGTSADHDLRYDYRGASTEAVDEHSHADDPHGDRAWATTQFEVKIPRDGALPGMVPILQSDGTLLFGWPTVN